MGHAPPVLDLAGKFADGTLSTRKLLEADDDELRRMLIEVRGIGPVSAFDGRCSLQHFKFIIINC